MSVAEPVASPAPPLPTPHASEALRRVAVVAIGNVLHGDDGLGPFALRALQEQLALPDEVPVVDLGTPGPEFAHYILDWDVMIVLDAVLLDAPPGTVRLMRRDEVLRKAPPMRLTPHDASLRDALLTAEFAGQGPQEVLLVGVVPESTEKGTYITPTVRAAVPEVIAAVQAELARWGVTVERRAPGAIDDRPDWTDIGIFWE